ncbi:MFS transporter [Streptomyces sp. NPDC048191]|uniref:MFS transporter n=1 Tax=Streptomyces sp. NPDC048191 TaxID=3155484 RepID=UPI003406FEC3
MARKGNENRGLFSATERLCLLGLGLAALAVQADWLAANLALPLISKHFSASTTDLHWVLSGFMLAFGSVLPITGRVADSYGRRKLTFLGLGVFALGSLVSASAESEWWLVLGRVIQGAGGAMILPATVSIVSAAFVGHRKAVALGIVLGSAGVGGALGPLIGGVLAQELGWRSVFYINAPVCLLSAVAISLFHQEGDTPEKPSPPPVINSALVSIGVVAISLAIDRGTAWGWTSKAILSITCCGGIALLSFALTERRRDNSLHPRSLYQDRRISAITLAGTVATFIFTLLSFFSVMALQEVHSLSSVKAGLIFLCLSVMDVLATYAAGHLSNSKFSFLAVFAAMWVLAVALLCLASSNALLPYVLFLAACGLGIGMTGGISNVLTQHYVEPSKAGSALSYTLAIKMLSSSLLLSLASTILESLNGGVAGASRNGSAINEIFAYSAGLTAFGAIVTILLMLHTTRRGRHDFMKVLARGRGRSKTGR